MKNTEAIEMVKELTAATIAHYRAVNESSRSSEKCARIEAAAARKVLAALMGSEPSESDVNAILG